MLSESSTRGAIISLTAAVLVVACGEIKIPAFKIVELHRSADQSLVVANATDVTIHVMPATTGAPVIEIKSGDHWTTQFTVVTLATRDAVGVVVAGSQHNDIKPVGGTRYLTSAGEDWVLTASPGDDPWKHGMFFGECWFAGPATSATYHLDVAAPPIPGLPTEICP